MRTATVGIDSDLSRLMTQLWTCIPPLQHFDAYMQIARPGNQCSILQPIAAADSQLHAYLLELVSKQVCNAEQQILPLLPFSLELALPLVVLLLHNFLDVLRQNEPYIILPIDLQQKSVLNGATPRSRPQYMQWCHGKTGVDKRKKRGG